MSCNGSNKTLQRNQLDAYLLQQRLRPGLYGNSGFRCTAKVHEYRCHAIVSDHDIPNPKIAQSRDDRSH